MVISLLFIVVSIFVQLLFRRFVTISDKYETKILFQKEAERVVALLLEQSQSGADAQQADSFHDTIFEDIKECSIAGATIILEDVSSLINPNQVHNNLLENPEFAEFFAEGANPGETIASFRDYRHDYGLTLNIITGYADFFKEEYLLEYFSPYSYFNINTTDLDVLGKLYELRTGKGEEGAETFMDILDNFIEKDINTNKGTGIIGRGKLFNFMQENNLEEDYIALFPIINTQPLYNVNFIPEKILKAVLYYNFKVNDKVYEGYLKKKRGSKAKRVKIFPEVYDNLIAERTDKELTESDLERIIKGQMEGKNVPAYRDTKLEHYLGVNTWFWRIIITDGSSELSWLVARIPGIEEEEQVQFKLIEETFK